MRSVFASRVAIFARDLAAYSAVLMVAGYGLTILAEKVTQRAAAPVARLLDMGDGFAVAPDQKAAVPVQTASRVLEGDSWLENLKTTWQSGRQLSSARSESRLGGPDPAERNWSRPSKGTTHRTMCVRLCDGYYFPVSFATTEDKFERDEQVCANSCSSPAKLYVYRNPGQNPEDMVSRGGQPYSKLSTAFQFRKAVDQTCKCTPDPWSQEAQDRHRQYAEQAAGKVQTAQAMAPKGKQVSDAGRKKSAKGASLKEAPDPAAASGLPSQPAVVRVANASAGIPIGNVQLLTNAQGSVPQATDRHPVPVSLTSAPVSDVGAVPPTSPKAKSGDIGPRKAATAATGSGPKKKTSTEKAGSAAGGGSAKSSVLASKPIGSSDWKVAVFTSR